MPRVTSPDLMSKSPDAFRTISEVADWLGLEAHVLRFWESKFAQVKPVKRAGGRRYYRPADMLLLGGIKKLLHEDGLTIKGAQKLLREKGVAFVADQSPPLDDLTIAVLEESSGVRSAEAAPTDMAPLPLAEKEPETAAPEPASPGSETRPPEDLAVDRPAAAAATRAERTDDASIAEDESARAPAGDQTPGSDAHITTATDAPQPDPQENAPAGVSPQAEEPSPSGEGSPQTQPPTAAEQDDEPGGINTTEKPAAPRNGSAFSSRRRQPPAETDVPTPVPAASEHAVSASGPDGEDAGDASEPIETAAEEQASLPLLDRPQKARDANMRQSDERTADTVSEDTNLRADADAGGAAQAAMEDMSSEDATGTAAPEVPRIAVPADREAPADEAIAMETVAKDATQELAAEGDEDKGPFRVNPPVADAPVAKPRIVDVSLPDEATIAAVPRVLSALAANPTLTSENRVALRPLLARLVAHRDRLVAADPDRPKG